MFFPSHVCHSEGVIDSTLIAVGERMRRPVIDRLQTNNVRSSECECVWLRRERGHRIASDDGTTRVGLEFLRLRRSSRRSAKGDSAQGEQASTRIQPSPPTASVSGARRRFFDRFIAVNCARRIVHKQRKQRAWHTETGASGAATRTRQRRTTRAASTLERK